MSSFVSSFRSTMAIVRPFQISNALHTTCPMPARRRKNPRFTRMAAQLKSQAGRSRHCRQPQAVEKAAALRQADVEQIAGSTVDRCLRINEPCQRFIEHDRHANLFRTSASRPTSACGTGCSTQLMPNFSSGSILATAVDAAPRFVRIQPQVHARADPPPYRLAVAPTSSSPRAPTFTLHCRNP